MVDESAVMPGSPVFATDGAIGVIERVVTEAGGSALVAIVVRTDPAGQRYRVPARLISGMHSAGDTTAVDLSLSQETLERYQLPHTQDAMTTERPVELTHLSERHQSEGGLIERLHAGLDALAGGVRDAWEGSEEGSAVVAADDDTVALRVPVFEEHIVTQTAPVRIGTVHVHKNTELVEETVTVAVSHEEPDIAYISVDDYDPKSPYHPGETYIPIMGEKLVVEKRQVIMGYLRVRTHLVSEERQVTETLRREHVTVDQEPVHTES